MAVPGTTALPGGLPSCPWLRRSTSRNVPSKFVRLLAARGNAGSRRKSELASCQFDVILESTPGAGGWKSVTPRLGHPRPDGVFSIVRSKSWFKRVGRCVRITIASRGDKNEQLSWNNSGDNTALRDSHSAR